MKNKLIKLQESLQVHKGQRVLPGNAWIEPNEDYYTEYAIRELLKIYENFPSRNLIEEAKKGIDDSLINSDTTCYFLEYSQGYRNVYEYLKK